MTDTNPHPVLFEVATNPDAAVRHPATAPDR
jgi:hypothetical protein